MNKIIVEYWEVTKVDNRGEGTLRLRRRKFGTQRQANEFCKDFVVDSCEARRKVGNKIWIK